MPKLEDFRLESYDERSILVTALSLYQQRYDDSQREVVQTLLMRLSRTECQPGGCEYCNADRSQEEAEWRDRE